VTLQAQIDGTFTGGGVTLNLNTITGGEATADTSRTRDPGEKYDRPVIGPPTRSNVVGTVNYEQGLHGTVWAVLDGLVGTGTEFSISRVIRDGNQNRSGTKTYTGFLVRCTGPEGNTGGGTDQGTLEFEWAVLGPSA
jgi:hypothetical protein